MPLKPWIPPPVSAVRAFESAARHQSFTRAAEELHITQSAVSHAIRELEQRFHEKLFARNGKALALTDAGKTYLAFASEALQRLRAGDAALADPVRRTRVLTVSVSPSFAAKWLVPRLGEFTAVYQDIDLRISANPKHVDFIDDEIDLAVRHGDGNWPHLHCVRLCTESMFPVCSPSLRKSHTLARVDDLANFQLIHHAKRRTWSHWLDSFGAGDLPNCTHGPIFNEMSLAIDAAIAGQGIALARTALAARDLVDRRLIRPLKESLPVDFSYWIVWPKAASGSNKIERFTKWLLDQTRQDTLLMRDQLA